MESHWRPILPAPIAAPHQPIHPKHGHPSGIWHYHDASGGVLFLVCRFDSPDGGKEFSPFTFGTLNGRGGWHWKAPRVPRPLYGLDRLAVRPDAPVIICEGEKPADAAEKLFSDYVAITSPNGAKAANNADWAPLAGRRVIIWPDHDEEGTGYAADAARLSSKAGATSVATVLVPEEFPHKWDLADDLPESWRVARLRTLLQGAKPSGTYNVREARHASPFVLRDDGVWHCDPEKSDTHLCGVLEVIAETRADDGSNWGVLLRWQDHDGQPHQWPMPRSMLAGDGTEYRSCLLDGGLYIAPGRKPRELLTTFLASARTPARARAVTRVGWHERVFVMPEGAYGETGGERMLLQTAGAADHAFRVSGTLEDWQGNVARYAIGNSRLALALSAAFAAPLLYLAGAESGGFHFRGPSSIGKTTALLVAGSAWGGGGVNGYVCQWRATDNGLEGLAARHCDCLLCLDELAQVMPQAAGAAAYMLANGAGKTRAGRTGESRAPQKWRTLFLSSGEISIADKVAEDGRGRKASAGQHVRVIDLPADAGAGLGMFESLHGFASADALARHLRHAISGYYGTAACAFLERIAPRVEEIVPAIDGFCKEFLKEHCPAEADGQVKRAADRFGLVAAAGELATTLGILPWQRGEALGAAGACFQAWLKARGGYGAAEISEGVRQVRRFIEQHGESRFAPWGNAGETSDRPTINRAGFRKPGEFGGVEYFILPEVWRTEVCLGFDAHALARVLVERRLLIPDAHDGKPQSRHRLPGTDVVRCYRLSSAILGGDDA
jgi:uncharacterized protein (DUF927 family)